MIYLMKGNFWLLGGRIFGIGTGMLLTLAFANLLDPTAFGTYKYVLALAGTIGALSLGGMGGAVGRAMAIGRQNVIPGIARINFLWSLPSAAIALAISVWYFWNGNMVLGGGLLLIAVTTPFMNNFGLSKSIFIGKGDFQTLFLMNLPRSALSIAALILALFLTKNVLVILIVYFVSNYIASWSGYRYALRKFDIKDDPTHVAETVTYGKHLSVMGTISQIIGNLDQLLLFQFVGPVALATYTFSLAPIRELRNFSDNINPLIFPKYATKTVEEMKQTAPLRMKQIFVVSVAVGLIYIAAAPYLFKIFFPQYIGAVLASQILALGLVFQPRNIVEIMFYAQGNVNLRYITTTVSQGARVLLWIVMIPLWGLMGAVWGILIADAIGALTLWWAYKQMR
ncbi:oligosaccharide flippase family protein [Candidatus Parcubacteria bacterium]|nr:oligosaccharide flippase family protein [Candidatus Parcubacteria bacterium]